MKFHEYLEALYVKTNIALQQAYHPYGQAKVQAVQTLINLQKRVYTWLHFILIPIEFILVKLHIMKEPPSPQAQVESLAAKAAEQEALKQERQAKIQAELEAQQKEANQGV
jgi:Ni,Fe-hydrogenase III small subunit